MFTRILSAVLATGFLLSAAPLAAQAAATPKTKAACEKVKNMKWDDTSSKCVKK
jgi:ABC-type Fe2+-enterobactin transport system substrate-binding protein